MENIDFALLNARQLITPRWVAGEGNKGMHQGALDVIEDGALVAKGGTIKAVGTTQEILTKFDLSAASILHATGSVVSPGLVDAHTHPIFEGQRFEEYNSLLVGKVPDGSKGSGGGIWDTVLRTRSADEEALFEAALGYLKHMVRNGTTTVECKSGYGLTYSSELRDLRLIRRLSEVLPINITATFLGAHFIPRDAESETKYLDIVIEEMLPDIHESRLATAVDISYGSRSFSRESVERLARRAADCGLLFRIHTDSRESSGGWRLACELGAVAADHLNYTPANEILEVGEADTVAALVPSAELFYQVSERGKARDFIKANSPVAITSDFCSSIHWTSVYHSMGFGAAWYGMSAEEVINAVTINAAFALRLQDQVGSLHAGKLADLVVWDIEDYRMLVFRVGDAPVRQVVRKGRIVYDATK